MNINTPAYEIRDHEGSGLLEPWQRRIKKKLEKSRQEDEWYEHVWEDQKSKGGKVVMIQLLRGPAVPCKAPVKIDPLSACAEAPVEKLPEMTEEEKRILAILLADDPEIIEDGFPAPEFNP